MNIETLGLVIVAAVVGFCACMVLASWLQARDEKRSNPFKGR